MADDRAFAATASSALSSAGKVVRTILQRTGGRVSPGSFARLARRAGDLRDRALRSLKRERHAPEGGLPGAE
jgi:hypothetical protein